MKLITNNCVHYSKSNLTQVEQIIQHLYGLRRSFLIFYGHDQISSHFSISFHSFNTFYVVHYAKFLSTEFKHAGRFQNPVGTCLVNLLPLQRVPALRAFWDLEKTVLHEICVSGTLLWFPTNANSPTYTYISQKSC